MILLDTCVMIYDALDAKRLSKKARKAIDSAEKTGELCCSDISLWEIAMLVERKRLDPGTDSLSFIRLALTSRSVTVLPITPEIAHRSATLPIPGDPADRLILATAIEHAATLVTPDKHLQKFGGVSTLWN